MNIVNKAILTSFQISSVVTWDLCPPVKEKNEGAGLFRPNFAFLHLVRSFHQIFYSCTNLPNKHQHKTHVSRKQRPISVCVNVQSLLTPLPPPPKKRPDICGLWLLSFYVGVKILLMLYYWQFINGIHRDAAILCHGYKNCDKGWLKLMVLWGAAFCSTRCRQAVAQETIYSGTMAELKLSNHDLLKHLNF